MTLHQRAPVGNAVVIATRECATDLWAYLPRSADQRGTPLGLRRLTSRMALTQLRRALLRRW
jgi:hypothetical protein